MIIRGFGLFWRRDEIVWFPGSGKKGAWRLLGRVGWNQGKIRMADFRSQTGIYILYGNYGLYYVGLTTKKGLGRRLKDHTIDEHQDNWDRFSWFGFQPVKQGTDDEGLRTLRKMPIRKRVAPGAIIADMEAMLIKAMALQNVAQMKFKGGEEWEQVKRDEVDELLEKIA